MKVLCIFVTVLVVVKCHYHYRVGIPRAAKIKAYEDKLFSNPEMESRIVGGSVAADHAHPYMAGLIILVRDMNASMCGASLVSTTRLVTAGHCLDLGTSVKARIGSNYLYHHGVVRVTPVFVTHPRFKYVPDDQYANNDVGIVILLEPVTLYEHIQIICLPCSKNDVENIGDYAVAAGWGLTSDADRDPAISPVLTYNWTLREVGLWLIEGDVCERAFNSFHMHGKIICTEGRWTAGVCDGDSGGPLTIERNGHRILAGITSHGNDECDHSLANVFIRTQSYRDFLIN